MARMTKEELARKSIEAQAQLEQTDAMRTLRKRQGEESEAQQRQFQLRIREERMLRQRLEKQAEKPKVVPCEHTDLKFEDGMLHLSCKKCKYTWVSVGHCPARAIHDISARGRTPRHPTRQAPGTRSDIS